METRGCIFDFDGVILDTEKYHYISWNRALGLIGVKLSPIEYEPLKSTGRNYIIDFVARKFDRQIDEQTRQLIASTKHSVFLEVAKDLSRDDLIGGVLPFLHLLKDNGYKLAVASSGVSTKGLIDKLGIGDFFDSIIDGNCSFPQKPEPTVFLESAKRLGLMPQECVVFEDSWAGITAGTTANIPCVYIGQLNNKDAKLNIKDFIGCDLSMFKLLK